MLRSRELEILETSELESNILPPTLPKIQSNFFSRAGSLAISLSQHTRKDFQVIIAFGHSAFVTSQSLFVPTNMVLKRY